MPGTASAAEFHSEGENTHTHGTGRNVRFLNSTAGDLTCEHKTWTSASPPKTTRKKYFKSTYVGCHMIVFGSTISATVNMNECEEVYYATGEVDIVCPSGKKIVATGAGCTIEVGSQTGLKTATYTNNGLHLDVTTNLSGIKYTHSGFTCGTGSGTTGTSTSGMTVAGNKGKIWFE
jgi:hypothetical protein